MNTFKKIKYFKLDSMNPKDVEDYMGSFNSSFNEDQDDINLIYRTLTTVAALCGQKCRAFHGLGKYFYFTSSKLLVTLNLFMSSCTVFWDNTTKLCDENLLLFTFLTGKLRKNLFWTNKKSSKNIVPTA